MEGTEGWSGDVSRENFYKGLREKQPGLKLG